MKQKFLLFIFLLGALSIVSLSNAQGIIHDPEHHTMEEVMGDKWKANEKIVQDKLAALEKKYGKKPNIISVLVDDVGYSELGVYGGGKLRGAPTPNLDKMANQGMKFLQYYSEPACTPTRMSLNTGRYHVRSGVNQVLFPGMVNQGIHADEVALAEIMSEAGYNTGMFGKWHLGFGEKYAPVNHGFDEAVWSEGNPVTWVQDVKQTDMTGHTNAGAYVWGPKKMRASYLEEGVMKAKKGEKPQFVYAMTPETYDTYDSDVTDLAIDYIKRKADDEKPFFLYVGGKGNHFIGANPDFMDTPAQTNTAAQLTESDYNLGRIIKTLKDLDIDENTLVVWSSDNGPMYAWQPHGGYSYFDKGEKGQTWEGGVRVPCIAWWPGMIEEGQDPLDLFHVSDWYTTFATIAGAKHKIPTDRVVDGIDQSPLLFLGEDNGERDYNYYYNKGKLEAIRKDWTKIYFGGSKVFLPIVNLMHDPMERYLTEINYAAYEPVSLMHMFQEHTKQIQEYPHRVQPPAIRKPDYPYDPAPSLEWKSKKQVDW